MRKAEIYLYDRLAGLLIEDENGYTFQYNEDYLADNPKVSEILKSRTIEIAIPGKESTNSLGRPVSLSISGAAELAAAKNKITIPPMREQKSLITLTVPKSSPHRFPTLVCALKSAITSSFCAVSRIMPIFLIYFHRKQIQQCKFRSL